jgi:hypothetical protein
MTLRPVVALAVVAIALAMGACASSYTPEDTTANTVSAENEARQLERCAVDDAGGCSPAFMRITAATAYCANARELAAHGAPVPEAGTECPKAAP